MSDIPKQIPPSASIKKYLDDTLELEKFRKSGKKTFDGSSIGSKELSEIKLKLRNNDDAKGRAIDNLFKSMANLIYFFEFVNEHHKLIDKFAEDIEDLLGLKSGSDGPRNPRGEGFPRIIRAVTGEGYPDYDNVKFNYRRRMLKVMQHSINQKAMLLVAYSKKDPLGISDVEFQKKIGDELQQAKLWINYLDRKTGNESKKPNRLLDF